MEEDYTEEALDEAKTAIIAFCMVLNDHLDQQDRLLPARPCRRTRQAADSCGARKCTPASQSNGEIKEPEKVPVLAGSTATPNNII